MPELAATGRRAIESIRCELRDHRRVPGSHPVLGLHGGRSVQRSAPGPAASWVLLAVAPVALAQPS